MGTERRRLLVLGALVAVLAVVLYLYLDRDDAGYGSRGIVQS